MKCSLKKQTKNKERKERRKEKEGNLKYHTLPPGGSVVKGMPPGLSI